MFEDLSNDMGAVPKGLAGPERSSGPASAKGSSKVSGKLTGKGPTKKAGKGAVEGGPAPQGPAGQEKDKRLKRPLSKRTGGPRTPGGVARASKNSLTHGAYASLPPETFEFMAYLDRARQELCPSGLVEDSLAASIAHSAYKAQRLREIEMGRMVRSGSKGLNTTLLAHRAGFPWQDTHHELLAEPINEVLLQRLVSDGWRRLAAPPVGVVRGEVLSMPDLRASGIYEEACGVLATKCLPQFMHEDFFVRLDAVMLEARTEASYLGRRLKQGADELFLVRYWLYRNAGRVNACALEMREDRTLELYRDEGLMRANAFVSSSMRNDIETLQAVKGIKDRRDAALQKRVGPGVR